MSGPAQGRLDALALYASLGYEPHAGQLAVHQSRAPRRVVACGVRWGKTLCAAMEGLAAALEPRERSIGWVMAPTYDLADRVFREIVRVAAQKIPHRIRALKEHEKRLLLWNLAGGVSEIRAKSADNPTSLLGEGLDYVIVDEASRLKPSIWEGHVSQRLMDRKGWALLISTPKGKGYFYDLFRKGQNGEPGYASWNQPSWTSPLLDRDAIEKEREHLPEAVWRQEYGAEFLEGAGAVFRNVRDCATGVWKEPVAGRSYVGGLDLAKTEDFTVLVLADKRQKEIVFADRFHRLDWAHQVNRIQGATRRYNRARFLVDSTGSGEPVYESLRREGCCAQAYPFTQKSKAALINNLSMLLEQRQIVLPKPELWPEGIEELEAFEYSVTEQGTVRSGAPGGQHDDCVIALSLAAWHFRPVQKVWAIVVG